MTAAQFKEQHPDKAHLQGNELWDAMEDELIKSTKGMYQPDDRIIKVDVQGYEVYMSEQMYKELFTPNLLPGAKEPFTNFSFMELDVSDDKFKWEVPKIPDTWFVHVIDQVEGKTTLYHFRSNYFMKGDMIAEIDDKGEFIKPYWLVIHDPIMFGGNKHIDPSWIYQLDKPMDNPKGKRLAKVASVIADKQNT